MTVPGLLVQGGGSKAVAVKGFLSPESAADTQDCFVEELLEISKQQENLYYAYKWVTVMLTHNTHAL